MLRTHISESRCGAPNGKVVGRCGPPATLIWTTRPTQEAVTHPPSPWRKVFKTKGLPKVFKTGEIRQSIHGEGLMGVVCASLLLVCASGVTWLY